MRQELEEKLFNEFPLLYKNDESICVSLMYFGFACGDGWYELIRELSKKLYPLIQKCRSEQDDDAFQMRASQVKEKYGTLRFYMSCETGEMSEIIEEYENRSGEICEECGAAGKIRSRGHWMYTTCEEHIP